ncbi:MAG: thiamine phosphate synthase [Vicinamibacterales bacterium]
MSPTALSRLYAICDADACASAGWTLVDFAAACLDGGATLLQIRAKGLGSRDFLDAALRIVERARAAKAIVIVNDRADVACVSDAAGVHVGQDDLTPSDTRSILGNRAIVGLSTHTPDQIAAAVRAPITYLAIGPVFGTDTKATGYMPVGLRMVTAAAEAAATAKLPVVAIGGITLDRAEAVIEAGADSVAVVSDLFTGGAPAARVRDFLRRLG